MDFLSNTQVDLYDSWTIILHLFWDQEIFHEYYKSAIVMLLCNIYAVCLSHPTVHNFEQIILILIL